MLDKIVESAKRPDVRASWQGLTQVNRVNVNESERFISLIGGGLLFLVGLLRRSLKGLGFLFGGGYLIYRGLTGHCTLYEFFGLSSASRTERLQFRARSRSSSETGRERPEGTIETGRSAEEASWASFPASDPPAWTASRAGKYPN